MFAADRQLPSVRAIGTPNCASGVQTRRSQARAMAQPPPAATPCDLGDRGNRHALEPIDHRIEPALVRERILARERARELRDVGAGGERTAGALQDEDADVTVGVHAVAGLDQRVVHLPGHRVPGLGTIERQRRDRTVGGEYVWMWT